MKREFSREYQVRLADARKRTDLSQSEMASRLLTPLQTDKQWERGSRSVPGVAVIAAESLCPRWPSRLPEEGTVAAKIFELADGNLTVSEIAANVERKENFVRANIQELRARGFKPTFKPFERAEKMEAQ